jgi:hypothetical protein
LETIKGSLSESFPSACRSAWAEKVKSVLQKGKEAVNLLPGTVITIPANVKHWHGAQADSWFSHIAIEIPGTNGSTEWCEPVDDEMYRRLS